MKKLPPALLAVLLSAGLAQADEPAPNADKRALQLAVQRDARQQQSAAASLTLPVGRSAWLQAGVGGTRSRGEAGSQTSRPAQVLLGGGVAGPRWQASLNAARRRDGDALRQTDVTAALDWRPNDSVGVGLDATHRSARASAAATTNGGAAVPVTQRVKGHGVGVHGAVAVTPRLTVYGATLRNHYRVSTTQGSAANTGLLAPLLPGRVSAVNRDEAALDRSHQLGATWRAGERVALNGEVLQDRLHDGGTLRSVQVKAAVSAGAGWTITPGLGRSRAPNGEGVNYGSLAASYAW